MKLEVTGIKKHDHGFDQFDRCGESTVVVGDWESIKEYADHVASQDPSVRCYAIDPDIAEMGDEDGEELAEALRAATHNVCGGHDTLVAYHCGCDGTGEPVIQIESVREVAAVEA